MGATVKAFRASKALLWNSEIKNKGNHILCHKWEHLYPNLNVMRLWNTVICNIVFLSSFTSKSMHQLDFNTSQRLDFNHTFFLLTTLFVSSSIWKTGTVLHFKLRFYHVWRLSPLFSIMYNLLYLREKCNCVNSLQWLSDVLGSEYENKMCKETNYFDILHLTVVINLYQRWI